MCVRQSLSLAKLAFTAAANEINCLCAEWHFEPCQAENNSELIPNVPPQRHERVPATGAGKFVSEPAPAPPHIAVSCPIILVTN